MAIQDKSTPISRCQVFDRLNDERDYQIRRWGVRQEDGTLIEAAHSVEEFLLYMQDYLTSAIHRISREPDAHGGLGEMRKVVTLGIACMEQHGAPCRDLTNVTNGRDGLPA